ncbi:MAG TPA: class IV adenylate cyclase [Baekduia sp.]|nr:class IV adenylate cyclase [Baekduia sp.]
MSTGRNVELKARDPEPAATLAAALALGAVDAGVLEQRDTYFSVPAGRLKLREERRDAAPARAELIAYQRADAAVARRSAYHRAPVDDPEATSAALGAALGVTGVVAKRRRLLLWEGVRIHLDEVDGLGTWVELEAVAAPGSDLAAEHAKVAELRRALGVLDEHVVAEGYAALLEHAEPVE